MLTNESPQYARLMPDVKPPNKRTEQARRTRATIIDAGRELFLDQGYGATSVPEVAARAGVAVQTVYFVFRTKRGLLKAIVDTTIAGDLEPVATMERPWFADALGASTAAELVRKHVHGTTRILERVAPITPLIASAAATDPEVAALWPRGDDPRLTVHRAAAEALVEKPGAKPGLSADLAADLLFGLLSPELYLLFVRDRQWPRAAWEEWARATLTEQLCADRGAEAPPD